VVPPPGYDPGSSDFQSVAMTTSAKAALNFLVPTEGNDPSSIAYQASALPLSYAGKLYGAQGEIRTHDFRDLQSLALGRSATCA